MTWSQVRANWHLLTDQVRGRWPQLSREDVEGVGGDRPKLIALLELRRGLARAEAAELADGFVRSLQVFSL